MLELFTSERRAREEATIESLPTELMDIILKNLKADFNLQEITEDFINEYRCEKGRFESYKDDDDYEAAEEEEEIIEIEAESRKHCKVSAENWRIVEWGNCNDCFDLNFNGDSFLSSDTIGIVSPLPIRSSDRI